VKVKPQIVVLSDSEEDNHEGGDAPCHTEYSKTCSEYTVQQMKPQLNFYFLVYGFRCNELQRIDEQLVSDRHFLFFPFHMQALRSIILLCTNKGHYCYCRTYV